MGQITNSAARLAEWLLSNDVADVLRAIEVGLQTDIAVLDELFASATWEEVKHFELASWSGHRIALDPSRWPAPDDETNDHLLSAACLRLLAASNSPLKQMSTIALHVDIRDTDGCPLFDNLNWLAGFPNLRRLHLVGNGPPEQYIASLSNLPLRDLIIVNYGVPATLGSHGSLQRLIAAGVGFETDASWPYLKQVRLQGQWNLEALFEGANQLAHATLQMIILNHFTGGDQQMGPGLTRVSSPRVKSLDLDGNYHVHNCPRLESLKMSGKASITEVPKLNDLVLGRVNFENRTDLWELHSVKRIWIDHVIAAVVSTPPNATRFEYPEQRRQAVTLDVGHRIYDFPLDGLNELAVSCIEENFHLLEPLRAANDLIKLTLSGAVTNLDPISKLANLRAIDISYCPLLTDLTSLVNLPWIHTVTVDKLQPLVIPPELDPFIDYVEANNDDHFLL